MTAAAVALAACSSGGTGGSEGGESTDGAGAGGGSGDFSGETLVVMHYEGTDSAMGIAWDKAIEIFEEETGATVDLQITAFEDLQVSAGQLFDSSDAPDVSEFNKGNGTAGQLAAIGVIQNLNDLYSEFGWEESLADSIP